MNQSFLFQDKENLYFEYKKISIELIFERCDSCKSEYLIHKQLSILNEIKDKMVSDGSFNEVTKHLDNKDRKNLDKTNGWFLLRLIQSKTRLIQCYNMV